MAAKLNWKNEDGQHLEASTEKCLQKILPWLVEDLRSFVTFDLTGKRLLEIGCGPGFMLELFYEVVKIPVFAVDISWSMLRNSAGSGRLGNAIALVADVEKMPFVRDSFDIVFSRGSVFFWQNTEQAFKGIYKILKSGGTAVIGGGYGLSTPQSIIDELRKDRPEKNKKIPRLNLDDLLAMALKTGGQCEVSQVPDRGFWLIIRKP